MVGMLGHIGIGKETTWGTGVAVTDYVEALSESVISTIERYETRNIYAGIHEADDADGMRRHEGDISFAINPRNVGHFLLGGLGVNSVAVVLSGSHFTNHFAPVQTLISSRHPLAAYTLEIHRPAHTTTASSFRYTGAQIAKLSFNVKPNQEARLTASIIAADATLLTKTTATFPTSPVQFFTFDQASVQLGGAAMDRFEDITIEIDNQLEGIATLDGSTTISRVRRTGPQLIRISGTFGFDDFTDFLSFRNQTEQRLTLSMFRASSFALVLDLPRVVFTEMPVQIGGRERLTVDFAGMARFHTGSNMALRASLTTVTTY
jgi:hypothetical protein